MTISLQSYQCSDTVSVDTLYSNSVGYLWFLTLICFFITTHATAYFSSSSYLFPNTSCRCEDANEVDRVGRQEQPYEIRKGDLRAQQARLVHGVGSGSRKGHR